MSEAKLITAARAFKVVQLTTEVGNRVGWRTIEAGTNQRWEQDSKPSGAHDEKNQFAHEFIIVLQNCYKTDNMG